jgi:alpha-L-fucosidase
MPKIASMARSYQPDMLIVDRTVSGEFENYQTPERGIPDVQLPHPWESCIPLGNDWGYVPADVYKSPAEVIHILVEIAAKGGNLLLGIGPKPDGTLPDEVISCLEKIGEWLSKNGEAIYNTRTTEFYNDKNTWFTKSKDGNKTYVIYCLEENKPVPEKIAWKGNIPDKNSKIIFLETGKPVKWSMNNEGVEIVVPKGLPVNQAAIGFSFL